MRMMDPTENDKEEKQEEQWQDEYNTFHGGSEWIAQQDTPYGSFVNVGRSHCVGPWVNATTTTIATAATDKDVADISSSPSQNNNKIHDTKPIITAWKPSWLSCHHQHHDYGETRHDSTAAARRRGYSSSIMVADCGSYLTQQQQPNDAARQENDDDDDDDDSPSWAVFSMTSSLSSSESSGWVNTNHGVHHEDFYMMKSHDHSTKRNCSSSNGSSNNSTTTNGQTSSDDEDDEEASTLPQSSMEQQPQVIPTRQDRWSFRRGRRDSRAGSRRSPKRMVKTTMVSSSMPDMAGVWRVNHGGSSPHHHSPMETTMPPWLDYNIQNNDDNHVIDWEIAIMMDKIDKQRARRGACWKLFFLTLCVVVLTMAGWVAHKISYNYLNGKTDSNAIRGSSVGFDQEGSRTQAHGNGEDYSTSRGKSACEDPPSPLTKGQQECAFFTTWIMNELSEPARALAQNSLLAMEYCPCDDTTIIPIDGSTTTPVRVCETDTYQLKQQYCQETVPAASLEGSYADILTTEIYNDFLQTTRELNENTILSEAEIRLETEAAIRSLRSELEQMVYNEGPNCLQACAIFVQTLCCNTRAQPQRQLWG